ncbi:unnamed protein product [Thlaspi arvense]|uniref:Phosphoglycerate kinase n=1 Tax=Thlaspi arvense TaxID=13288 RepID=A0AAU9RW52_THLAR|nr:unnamed protein product [Thlaspi arvense]
MFFFIIKDENFFAFSYGDALTVRVAKQLEPSVAEFLMEKELDYLVGAEANLQKPLAAIFGGSKVSTKIVVIKSLLEKADVLLLGGVIEKAKSKGVSLTLPSDIVPAFGIPDGWMGFDIGLDTIKDFDEALDSTKTVIWNGPMGALEMEKFAAGTEAQKTPCVLYFSVLAISCSY